MTLALRVADADRALQRGGRLRVDFQLFGDDLENAKLLDVEAVVRRCDLQGKRVGCVAQLLG
jgi:hypothetical protein